MIEFTILGKRKGIFNSMITMSNLRFIVWMATSYFLGFAIVLIILDLIASQEARMFIGG